MKNKTYILLPLFMTFSLNGNAQDNLSFNIGRFASETTSTYEDEQQFINDRLDNHMSLQLLHTGALRYRLTSMPDSAKRARHLALQHNILSLSGCTVNKSGQYDITQGRRLWNGRVLAGGEYTRKNQGTLWGMASYEMRHVYGVSMNYATHAEDYSPYFVGDTLGTYTLRQEVYTLRGGISFPLQGWNYGVDALYEGIAQSKTTDPRHSNYSYWARLALSAARSWRGNTLSLRAYPEINHQSISASSVNEALRFFQVYGFGHWNHRETAPALSYSRTGKITGGGIEVLGHHASNGARDWELMARLTYNYRKMSTEESSFKELFASTTHHFTQQITARKDWARQALVIQASAVENIRKGKENVYQSQLQDSTQYLYDYVLVGNNQLYTHNRYAFDLRTEYLFRTSLSDAWFVNGNISYLYDEEKYKSPEEKISVDNILTSLGGGYRHEGRNNTVEAHVKATLRMTQNGEYTRTGAMDYLTHQLAFVPYQLMDDNYQQIQATLSYSRKVDAKHSLGISLTGRYLNADIREHVFGSVNCFMLF